MTFRTIRLRRDPECPACGTRELKALIDYDEFCGTRRNESVSLHAGVRELAPLELATRMRRADPLDVIDVREPYEWRIARIEGARMIPLGRIGAAVGDLPRDREIVLYCHHGVRSRAAAEFLASQGFDGVWNLSGGIDRWSAEVDPTVPTY